MALARHALAAGAAPLPAPAVQVPAPPSAAHCAAWLGAGHGLNEDPGASCLYVCAGLGSLPCLWCAAYVSPCERDALLRPPSVCMFRARACQMTEVA